jgi:uridine phosphorylase
MSRRVPAETLHLRPHAEVAERVLLPGDPGRAMRIAQLLLDTPRMLNHHRGLWGYTGAAADGRPLTVQSTGMGGPSAAIVCEELLRLGARRFVRVGTCGALVPGLRPGELVVADGVLAEDGASRALGAAGRVAPDAALHAGLLAAAPEAHAGLVVSADLFYDPDPGRAARWVAAGAIAVDMEAATVLRVAERAGAAAACVLAVSDAPANGGRQRIDADALEAAEQALGRAGAAALGMAGAAGQAWLPEVAARDPERRR